MAFLLEYFCPLFSSLCSQSGHAVQKNRRKITGWAVSRLNLIKGRSAFKCLLFPQAKRLWASLLQPVRPAQTPLPLDAINIERIPWPALPSYNNGVRTKVNALNLISVLVIFNGVVMQGKGDINEEGGSRSGERLVVSGGLRRKKNSLLVSINSMSCLIFFNPPRLFSLPSCANMKLGKTNEKAS